MTPRAERQRNARLFADALVEAFERKYTEALESSKALILNEQTVRAAERRFAEYHRRRRMKKAMIAAVIAATTVLCGCATYVYREQITEFLLEHTPICVNLLPASEADSADGSMPCYGLSYVPDGYELTDGSVTYSHVAYQWNNSDGATMRFSQHRTDSVYSMNNQGEEKYSIEHNDLKILYIELNENYHTYVWRQGNYNLVISSNTQIAEDELKLMIDGLEITEYKDKD